jgi:hypothetical protein
MGKQQEVTPQEIYDHLKGQVEEWLSSAGVKSSEGSPLLFSMMVMAMHAEPTQQSADGFSHMVSVYFHKNLFDIDKKVFEEYENE